MSAGLYDGLAFGKGRTRKQEKAKAKRGAAAVVSQVRALVEARDVGCRVAAILTWCGCPIGTECHGPLEWAHLGGHRRFETGGRAPSDRHTTGGSAMLCKFHHGQYDAHQIELTPTTERGADGPLTLSRGTHTYREV